MFEDFLSVQKLIVVLIAGYLLGSIPFALVAARIRGVDIFTTGSTMAGAANVFWHIGHKTGAMVLAGDVAKGSAAVIAAGLLDLSPSALLLVGGAAVLGHWKSAFSGFRGGDGMATLMGVTIILEPALSALVITVGFMVVLLLWRAPLRSAWALFAGFTAMLAVSQYYQIDRELVVGIVTLALLVLFHSLVAKWRRWHFQVNSPDEPEL